MRAGRSGSARTSTTACSPSRARTCARRRTGASRPWPPRRRPRSLTIGADRRRAVFIEDRETSDVWLLDLESGSAPERLTTGRDPVPYWEDTRRSCRPTARRVAYVDDGHVWLVPAAGGPPRKLVEGGSPRWIDDAPARDQRRARRRHHHAARGGGRGRPVAAPPRRRARRARRARRRGRGRAVARRHRGGLHVHAEGRPEPQQRDPRGARRGRRGAPADRRARHARRRAGVVARRPDDRVRLRAERLLRAAPRGPRRRRTTASSRARAPTTPSTTGIRTARASSPSRGERNRFHLVVRGRRRRERRGAGARRHLVRAALDRGGRHRGRATRTTRRRASCGGSRPARTRPPRSTRPPRRRSGARRTRRSRTSPTSRSTASRYPRFLMRPRDASRGQARARGGLPARRAHRLLRRRVGRARAVLRGQGLRVARDQLPRLDRLRARLRAARTTATGAWATRRTASPPRTTCARSTGSTATGSASSARATAPTWRCCAVTDDPEHRFRCAVPKYGDCDITTSWAQGDRERRAGPRAHDGHARRRRARRTSPARPTTGSRTSRCRS